MKTRIRVDVAALHSAVDAARSSRGLSWRQLSGELGLSPSTMTRLTNGHGPATDAFATLVHWLGVPAERFMVDTREAPPTGPAEPGLSAHLESFLRARGDVAEEDVRFLGDVLDAALRRLHADPGKGLGKGP